MTPDDIVEALSIVCSTPQVRFAERRSNGDHYVPGFPIAILAAVVEARAEAALPLILAIHRQLTMVRKAETPLNEAIWRAAGSPSHKKRHGILRKLKALPGIIELTPDRTPVSHFRVRKGAAWIQLGNSVPNT